MLGFFKKKICKVVIEVKKMENCDVVEVIVWGVYMIFYVDGICDVKEIVIFEKIIVVLFVFFLFVGEIV